MTVDKSPATDTKDIAIMEDKNAPDGEIYNIVCVKRGKSAEKPNLIKWDKVLIAGVVLYMVAVICLSGIYGDSAINTNYYDTRKQFRPAMNWATLHLSAVGTNQDTVDSAYVKEIQVQMKKSDIQSKLSTSDIKVKKSGTDTYVFESPLLQQKFKNVVICTYAKFEATVHYHDVCLVFENGVFIRFHKFSYQALGTVDAFRKGKSHLRELHTIFQVGKKYQGKGQYEIAKTAGYSLQDHLSKFISNTSQEGELILTNITVAGKSVKKCNNRIQVCMEASRQLNSSDHSQVSKELYYTVQDKSTTEVLTSVTSDTLYYGIVYSNNRYFDNFFFDGYTIEEGTLRSISNPLILMNTKVTDSRYRISFAIQMLIIMLGYSVYFNFTALDSRSTYKYVTGYISSSKLFLLQNLVWYGSWELEYFIYNCKVLGMNGINLQIVPILLLILHVSEIIMIYFLISSIYVSYVTEDTGMLPSLEDLKDEVSRALKKINVHNFLASSFLTILTIVFVIIFFQSEGDYYYLGLPRSECTVTAECGKRVLPVTLLILGSIGLHGLRRFCFHHIAIKTLLQSPCGTSKFNNCFWNICMIKPVHDVVKKLSNTKLIKDTNVVDYSLVQSCGFLHIDDCMIRAKDILYYATITRANWFARQLNLSVIIWPITTTTTTDGNLVYHINNPVRLVSAEKFEFNSIDRTRVLLYGAAENVI